VPTTRLTKSAIDKAAPRERLYTINDSQIPGFMLRITPSGVKTFVYQYRPLGGRKSGTKTITIGRFGSITVDQARERARQFQAAVIAGRDPAQEKKERRNEWTVSDLCKDYLLHGTGTKKASTLATDRGRIERHIIPLLGSKRLSTVSQTDMEKFLRDVANGKTATDTRTRKRGRAIVRGGKGTASRTVSLLGGIFSYAIRNRLLEKNPVHGVRKYPDRRKDRFLTDAELEALGKALEEFQGKDPDRRGILVIRLLLLTGARKSEIERLQWSEVDLSTGHLRLMDSKTGQKVILLSSDARKVIKEAVALGGDPWVFPGNCLEKPFSGTPKIWARVRKLAGLGDVRLHDLRHTFASIAVSNNISLHIVAALLGHRDPSTTLRYAHLTADPVRNASDKIAEQIASQLTNTGKSAESNLP